MKASKLSTVPTFVSLHTYLLKYVTEQPVSLLCMGPPPHSLSLSAITKLCSYLWMQSCNHFFSKVPSRVSLKGLLLNPTMKSGLM